MQNLKRISKSQARYWFNKGADIYLNPSKMRLGGNWNMCHSFNKCPDTPDFDKLNNAYHYYNCTKETGRVIHFYKLKE